MKKLFIVLIVLLFSATATAGPWYSGGSGYSGTGAVVYTSGVPAANTNLTDFAGLTAASGIPYWSGTTLSNLTGTSSLIGFNGSGVPIEVTAHAHGDNDFAFYSTAASKGTLQILLSGSTNAKKYVLSSSHTDNWTATLPDRTGTIAYELPKEISRPSTVTLSVADVSGTFMNNYLQATDATLKLPTASPGYNFLYNVVTATAAYLRFETPGTTVFYLDEATTASGASLAATIAGRTLVVWTFQTGASTWAWKAASGKNAWTAY